MLNAFVYMFKDKNFLKKYLSLFGILLVANLLINWSGIYEPDLNGEATSIWYYILFFAGFITMFIPYGFSISLLRAKIDNVSEDELPSVNIVKNFLAGLKVVISGSLLVIPAVLFTYLFYFLNNNLLPKFGNLVFVITCAILFLAFFIVSFFFISMCCRYVVKPSFLNFLNFKAAAQLINCNVSKYFKSCLLAALCTAVVYLIPVLFVSFLTMLGFIGLVIYCIIVSLLWAYHTYILAAIFSSAVETEKI